MNLKIKGTVGEMFHSKKSGVTYLTLADVEQGGFFKIGVPGVGDSVKLGSEVEIDCEIKNCKGKDGDYLKVVKINKKGANN